MPPAPDPLPKPPLTHRCPCGYPLRDLGTGRCPECGRTVATASAAPIAQYRERALTRSVEFTLYPDKVVLRGAFRFGNAFVLAIALAKLEPDPSIFWQRSPSLKPGFTLLIVSIGFALVIRFGPVAQDLPAITLLVCALAGVAGLVAFLLGLRSTEYARFHTLGHPEVIALDVGRLGPDAARFDEFVAAINKGITDLRSLESL